MKIIKYVFNFVEKPLLHFLHFANHPSSCSVMSNPAIVVGTLDRTSFAYTSCYCEENVHKLCGELGSEDETRMRDLYVVFISNKNKTVPFWGHNTKSSINALTPVIWVSCPNIAPPPECSWRGGFPSFYS